MKDLSFFQKNSSGLFGAEIATEFGTNTVNYVEELTSLEDSINAFESYKTSSDQLKGNVAEFWHAGTFNLNAALNNSENRAVVNQSNDFASADISLSSGGSSSLKYYATGAKSAEQQAVSVFQRFKEYQGRGGKDSLEQFLHKRGVIRMNLYLMTLFIRSSIEFFQVIKGKKLLDGLNKR